MTTNRRAGNHTSASEELNDARADERDGNTMATPNGSTGDGDGQNVKASTAYDVASALRAQASRAAQATRDAAARVQEAVRNDEGADVPSGRRASGQPTGAEAAMAATSTTYETSRRDRSQRSGDGEPTGAAAAAAAPAQAPVVPPARSRPAAPPEGVDETQASLDARPAVARQPQSTPAPHVTSPPVRRGRVRKARLRLLRVDPWSVMKTAFLLSVALGIAVFVAVAVLWSVLDAAGVFGAVGGLVQDLTESESGAGVDIESYTSLSRVLGFTTLIAVVDVVLVTALATLGAFLYNLSAGLLGGLEVTLAEDD